MSSDGTALRGRSGKLGDAPVCPYCFADTKFVTASTDFNRGTTDLQFRYYQCAACGLVFMDAIPANLQPFYAGGYAPIPPSLAELRAVAASERYRLEPVLRYKSKGKLLEIGPWRGVFCINAKDAGFKVSAIEMDQDCVRFLRDTVGINAIASTDPAKTMYEMTETFDVIAMWHSLEHLKDPWKVVESAAARLAPEGILLIAIPNIESFEFKLLKERWRHLDAPRHLFFYPAQSLSNLCERNGLRTAEVHTHDHVSELLAQDTWFEWTKRHFGEHFYTSRLSRMIYRWARRKEKSRPHSGSGLAGVYQKVSE